MKKVKAPSHLRGRRASRDLASLARLEPLEPRLLMSGVPAAAPTFNLFTAAGTVQPATAASPYGMTPSLLRHAYGLNQVMFGSVVGDGAGQTIAIVDAYHAPTIVEDLHTFNLQFGLPDPVFTILGQDGSTNLPGTDPSGPGNSWAIETSLDVQWAHAAAPGANILLVEANSNSDTDLFAAIDTARNYPGVSAISMSWGSDEFAGQWMWDSHFVTPAGHGGVTFIASSGDSGAYSPNSHTRSVSFPASSPRVLSVGGTYLSADSSGTYVSESAWGNGTSSGSWGGSGGGISLYAAQPAWQNGVVTQTTSYRAVPDIAMDADPRSGVAVIDSWDFGASHPWAQVGGTSLSAPLWAGVIAIANQGIVLGGGSAMDGYSETLPRLYGMSATNYHDITAGNNGYAATAGYDLVTGRGTPIVNLLAATLADMPTPTPTPVPTIGSLAASPSSAYAGAPATLTAVNVQENSGTIASVTFYRESNGLGGLQIGADTLLGGGVPSGTSWSIALDTSLLAPGSYTYYGVATDTANVSSAAASTAMRILALAPTNDNFASPVVLAGSTATADGTNAAATRETSEPAHAGNRGGASVWYSWTAAADGRISLDTAGSNFDTLLAVYSGSTLGALTAVASNDDVPGGHGVTSALTFAAVAGTTYAIAIDGYNGATGQFTLNLAQMSAPANDNFAAAAALTGTDATWNGTNIAATRQAGEPSHAGNAGGASVWLAWTAADTSVFALSTRGSGFDTLLGVYTGGDVAGLIPVASNDNDPAGRTRTSALTFTAAAGTTYYFAIDGYNGATGSIVVTLAEIPPTNDSFAAATALSGTTATWTGTNLGATREAGEAANAGYPGGASVWFTWTAPASQVIKLNTTGSNFDTTLGVYTGTGVSALTLVAGNDDNRALHALTSALTFTATAGTTYHFAVDGYRAATGSIALNLSAQAAPANDSFAAAAALTGTAARWSGTNVGATREAGEPAHAGNSGGASVWLTWTAPASQTIRLNTRGSTFDTTLGVYTGSTVSALTAIASNDDDWARRTRTSALSFSAIAGTTYFFAIDGYNGLTGNILFSLAAISPLP